MKTRITTWALCLGTSLLVLAAAYMAVGSLAWNYFGSDSRPRPPTPLDLPLVPYWPAWILLVVVVGGTVLILWLDRGREGRVEPLALLALCLAVAGHAEAMYGAQAMASDTNAWPVNLVGVGLWLLLAASGTAVLAWVRILLLRRPVRGRILATCALGCSLGTAWMVHRFLVEERWTPIPDDGIQVPVVARSRSDTVLDPTLRPTPVVRVRADGTRASESISDLARGMEQKDGLPNEGILIRADRRARWSAVRGVVGEIQDAGIRKLLLSARWEEPAAATIVIAYLPKRVVHVEGAVPRPPSGTVRMDEDGALWLDQERCADLSDLRARLAQLPPSTNISPTTGEREPRELQLEPDGQATWGDVVAALSVAAEEFELIRLGPFALAVF